MPHHKSAEKRVRTNERDRKRNITVKSAVRTVIRKVRETAGDEKAPAALRDAHSVLDNAVRKGVLHKRTVDRKKSRLARLVNRKGAAAPPPPKNP
jgi:small subunit ribosomal protein S20